MLFFISSIFSFEKNKRASIVYPWGGAVTRHSLDYLVGNTNLLLDQTILDRIMDIQKLNDQDKADAFKLLDMFIRDAKARHTYHK
jgi:hypothetical protein